MDMKRPKKDDIAKYTLQLSEMSNDDLLEEVYWLSNVTAMEEWDNVEEIMEKLSKKELEKRLKEVGFLKNE